MGATDDLRSVAVSVGLDMPQAATLMMGAADAIDRINDENAKLRELVHALHWCKDYEQQKCYMCPLDGERYHRCDDIARELGVEVV